MALISRIVVSFVVSFLLKQIEKLHGALDWAAIKADLDQKVRDLLPGTWFDDEGVALCNSIVDAAERVLSEGDHIKKLMLLLAAKNYEDAFQELKDILTGALQHKISSLDESSTKADEHAAHALVNFTV